MQDLPIDRHLPDIRATLGRSSALVLIAPPGSGKTTRVPAALLDPAAPGRVLCVQPRRIAAVAAAHRVAQERGQDVGQQIGYRVRFDRKVSAATEVQRGLLGADWPGPPLKVRMGIHTGDAQERDGDYFGQAPNRAARIMAAAHAGQILCSGVTARPLEGDHPVAGSGRFRLRDLGERIELFQVAAPEGGAFPPPNTTLRGRGATERSGPLARATLGV